MESSIPVTNLDDVQNVAQSPVCSFQSPNNGGLVVGEAFQSNQTLTPAADQLELSSLDESTILKTEPPPQLESTRISSTCHPNDYEGEQDISKVQSESEFNAGFIKEDQSSGMDSAISVTPKVESMLESSVFELESGHDNSGVFNSPAGAAVDQSTEADAVDSKSTTIAADLDAAGQSDSSGSVEMAQEAVELNEVAAEEAGEADETAATAVEVAPTQSAVADVDDSISSDHEVEQLMKLPETVTEFVSKEGVKVYLVGTAHFSVESQEDVAKTILMTKPRVVMVELCVSRLNILRFDEQTILEEAQNLNLAKMRSTLKQYGAVQGALYLLFLSTSAHLTRQLGMAPGGEFRRAYHEARNVPGCRIHLGDRPIHITLHRALAALSLWQKAKLVWHLLLNRSSISPEEVERCKKKDLLEEMLEEMTGEFPALSRVFVQERDLCLAHSMQLAAADAATEARADNYAEPPSVVGVVGIGHVAGIVNYFGKVTEADVRNVMKVPPRSRAGRVMGVAVRLSALGLLAYGCYKCAPKVHAVVLSLRQMAFSR